MRFHIVKRDSCPFWKKLCLYLAAVAAALVLGGLLLMVMGVDPIAYYQRMFTMGMVGNKIAYKTFENYLKVFVPLVLTSVALSLAFKMRFGTSAARAVHPGGGGRRRRGPQAEGRPAPGGGPDPHVPGGYGRRRAVRRSGRGAEGEVRHQ